LTLGNGIAVWALQYIDSGLTALIISAQPLVLLLMMWFMDGKKIEKRSMIGIALGVLGIYLLVSQNSIEHNPNQWKGFIAIFLLQENPAELLTLDSRGFWSMVYLVFFGSIAAFTSFNYLLKRVSPEKVATSTYINPIVALILGAIVLNEKVSSLSMVAAVILLSGVYFINSTKSKQKSS